MSKTPKNSDLENTFFTAVKEGKTDEVRLLASTHAELVSAHDYQEFGGLALNLAAGHRRNLEMVELLLELGADPNGRSDWEPGPWSPSQISASTNGRSTILDRLIDAGAEVDAHVAAATDDIDRLTKLLRATPSLVGARGGDGCYPLHFAATPRIVDLLIKHGADLNGRDVDHYSTPVQWLCTRHSEATKHLFKLGADGDIFSAIACGAKEKVQEILREQPEQLGWCMNEIYFPLGPGDAQNIMTFTVGYQSTPLHAAAAGQAVEMTQLLIEAGADLNAPGGYDACSPLHVAAWHDHAAVAKVLLDAGANIEIESGKLHTNTPMGWAIVAGSVHVVKLLLERNCEIRDYYRTDAQQGINGDFKQYKTVPADNHRTILEMLERL